MKKGRRRPQADPLDELASKPTGIVSKGDLVHASDSASFDLTRRGAIGWVIKIATGDLGERLYYVGPREDQSHAFGGFLHARKIEKKEIHTLNLAYQESWQEFYSRRAEGQKVSMGDQIRAYLREEARRQKEAQCYKPDSCSHFSPQSMGSYSPSPDAMDGEADATTGEATGEISG